MLQNSKKLAEVQMMLIVMCNVFTCRDITSACNSINELQAAIQNSGITDEVKAALDTAREDDYTCVKFPDSTPKEFTILSFVQKPDGTNRNSSCTDWTTNKPTLLPRTHFNPKTLPWDTTTLEWDHVNTRGAPETQMPSWRTGSAPPKR